VRISGRVMSEPPMPSDPSSAPRWPPPSEVVALPPVAKPPYSSGTDNPKPPSSASPSMISSGMSRSCGAHARRGAGLLLGEAVKGLAHELEVGIEMARRALTASRPGRPGHGRRRRTRRRAPASRARRPSRARARACGWPGRPAPRPRTPQRCVPRARRAPVLEDAACGGHGRGGMGQVVGEHLVCVDAAEVDQRGGGRRHDALCEENSLRAALKSGRAVFDMERIYSPPDFLPKTVTSGEARSDRRPGRRRSATRGRWRPGPGRHRRAPLPMRRPR